ncbi:Enoyl-CoA hydratase/isomerase family protein [Flavobacterium indicum GPTSA100-9 = DSM 17447]|uniref:Enoyl-CoA hydratase/isomerase family protein n=1 Tax=Flavobacterium indicum (strain DSM 17447 / CIP 109464 / GPTSA100-9) TaxID=1094466 RepID=H8XP18_FLAIG|nr:enoyl-CoA hydratase/isomerase family protein [Flavobacterium indicum]CCG52285.1 Enoyl-CoA hydratase/isomerase family protein [Flavobacterium indicum GPTSA100-9 = DSM 17447]
MEAFVTSEVKDNLGIITFFHPAGNSFPGVQLQKLVDTLNELDQNSAVSVIVLQSEGNSFCAGASFDELVAIDNLVDGKQFFSGFANVINAMRKCSKLIIAKVQGKAVGGGVGIISAADYAIGTEKADIKLSELTIGIGPFVIEPAVSRKIGATAMAELTLDASNWKSAQWAFEKGLYAQLVPLEALNETTETFATQLASYNPEALAQMKKVLWQNTDNWSTLLYERAEISGTLVLSDFTKNALAKFKK